VVANPGATTKDITPKMVITITITINNKMFLHRD
jgi:hypothetical protein